MSSGSLPPDWSLQVSKRTGQQYWFNKRTNTSTYEEPEELRAFRLRHAGGPAPTSSGPGRGREGVVEAGKHVSSGSRESEGRGGEGEGGRRATAPPVRPPVLDGIEHSNGSKSASLKEAHADERRRDPLEVLRGLDSWGFVDLVCKQLPSINSVAPVEFRKVAIDICKAVVAVRDGTPAELTSHYAVNITGLTALGYFHFPPYESTRLLMLSDVVDEYGLKLFKAGEGDARHAIVYSESNKPPEVVEAEAAEAALEAEAESRRAAEAALMAAKASEALAQSATGAGGGQGKKSAKGAPRAIEDLAKDAIKVVPQFPVRDKRSIAEIQEDIKKRKRVDGESDGISKRQRADCGVDP